MSYRTISRSPISAQAAPKTKVGTLLDVRNFLNSDTTLPPRRRADYISAINSIGRIFMRDGESTVEQALSAIEACPTRLLPRLSELGHTEAEMTSKSLNNVRSRIRKALRVAGANVGDGRRQQRLAPEWNEIFNHLPPHPYKSGLGGFVTWCSDNGTLPSMVTQATLLNYAEVLHNSRIRKDARRTLLVTRRVWNQASQQMAGWPKVRLEVKYKLDHRYTLPLSAFDPAFGEEIMCRRHVVLNPDPTDDAAPPAIRQTTADADVYRLRRMASALVVATGRPPSTIRCIADLVEIDSAKAILTFLLQRKGSKAEKLKSTDNIFLLARFMYSLARRWLNAPEDQCKKLQGMARKLKPTEKGMRRKNRLMLQAFEDERLIARFLWLPTEISEATKKKSVIGRLDAVRFSVALAIALLCVAPVRPSNASSIRFNRNLIDTGTGAARRLRLHFDANEVKNDVELDFEITGVPLNMYDYYIDHVRPLLTNPDNQFLFPGVGNRSKVASYFSAQIAHMLQQELGQRVTAHQFRHLIGFLFLQQNPGNYEVVRQLLGHERMETTVRFYVGMSMPQAAKTVDASIAERRKELAHLAERPRGRRGQ